MSPESWVCTSCGYNMVGTRPGSCPFCGAPASRFLTSGECSRRYRVGQGVVKEGVTRLGSVPRLGLEHAAYRIEARGRILLIDCPSCFDRSVPRVDLILFTHPHFLGAVHQYRTFFPAWVAIHEKDADNPLCLGRTFDHTFARNFTDSGVEAFHIGGHTPGFTMYLFGGILFLCDYVIPDGEQMIFNPYGPPAGTRAGGEAIARIIAGRGIDTVCGWNYTMPFARWEELFHLLLET